MIEQDQESIYPRVRALERGLELIRVLGEIGWASPGELAKRTGIHRATVYRLLHTLEANGYVHCRPGDSHYCLTTRIRSIADGVKDEDWIAQVISPYLGRLLSQVQWPSDFATFTGGHIVIQESTHRFSPMSVNRGMIGKARPLLHSALGIAILSMVSDDSRQRILNLTELVTNEPLTQEDHYAQLMQSIQIARARGYAESAGGTEPNISAIASPVCWRNRVVGAINIMFFRRAMTPIKAAERYLGYLHECVRDIERELHDLPLGENYGWPRRRD
ncbi:IclR family transcriptional regulator C-terminal domain-containing protein [Paenalcaligenes sp.]|uniref:IclR family transcriptional regulator domain-containing protein n=1 Tax=Paenalcaligenes sp. TaxID=1966342 RepID=UPI002638B624|nr:IclR family transcriptional regulator C-terminal domain-containing protein [Paenalcaligenes sp.]